MKVIACIEDPVVIEKILTHLQAPEAADSAGLLPASRARPADLFGEYLETLPFVQMVAMKKKRKGFGWPEAWDCHQSGAGEGDG